LEAIAQCHALNAIARRLSARCPPAVLRAVGIIHRLPLHPDALHVPVAIAALAIENQPVTGSKGPVFVFTLRGCTKRGRQYSLFTVIAFWKFHYTLQ